MSRPDVLAALEAQRSKEAALKQTEVKDSVGTTGQAVPGKLAPKRMPGFEFDAVSNRWWPAGKAPKRAVVPIVPKAHISPPSSPSAMSTIARLYSRSVGTLTPSQFMHEAHHCTLRRLVPVLAGADEAGEPAVCVATSFDSRVFATVYSYRVDISSVIPVRGRVKWSLRTVPMEVSLPRAAVIVAAAFLDAATASGQYLLALGVSGVGTGPGLTLFLRFIVDDAGSVVPISSTYQHLVNVCVSSIAARDVCGPGGPLIAVGGAGTSNSPKLSSCFLRLGADVVLSRWSTRSDVFAVDCSAAHNNMVIAGCRNGEVRDSRCLCVCCASFA